METIIYNKYSNERIPEFNIRTEIVSDDGVKKICKYATNEEGYPHIKNMYKAYTTFQKLYGTDGLQVCPCVEEEHRVVFSYIEGTNLKDILSEMVAKDDMKSFYNIFNRYVGYLEKYSNLEEFYPCEEFQHVFGNKLPKYDKEVPIFKPANIDMVFDNIIEKDDTWYVIDYEWTFDIAVPMEFVLFRTIFYLMYNSPYQLKFEEMDLYSRVGIKKENLPIYEEMEAHFQAFVVGDVHAVKEYYQPGIDVKDIFVKRLWERDEIAFSVYKDTGNGFSESEKEKFVEKLDENRAFSFSYQIPENVTKLRLDPGEDSIVLHIDEIAEGIVETNGVYINEHTLYFGQSDPWIVFYRERILGDTLYLRGSVGKVDPVMQSDVNRLMEENRIINNSVVWKALRKLVTVEDLFKKVIDKVAKKKRYDKKIVPPIAIHLHLFYVDLLEEFVTYFKNIPYPFHLYISCVKGADVKYVENYTRSELSHMQEVVVKVLPNRGRDIAPFYVGFQKEIQQHKYVLHIHSKKSKHIEKGGSDWRVYSLDSLLGTKELVETIIQKFENEHSIGLIYPEVHPDIPMIGFTWMANGTGGQKLLEQMSIPYEEGLFSYPTGSFFWARVDAIRPIFEKGLSVKDFPAEKGQIDGTLAHVLERAIAFVNRAGGYHSYIVDVEEDAFRYDKSLKPFREYMCLDKEKMKEELMQYESISFGVFDTLLVSDFIDKETLQQVAVEQNQTELEALEQNVYPREEMLEVYRYLVEKGKRVAIVCDTEYKTAAIEGMLKKAGYEGYEKLFVSSERGYSKRNEHMWNIVYSEYDAATHIHVGADVYADWYTLEKRGAKSRWIMSGIEAYKLSNYYDANYKSLTLVDSLELGRKINKEWFNSPLDLIHNEGMK